MQRENVATIFMIKSLSYLILNGCHYNTFFILLIKEKVKSSKCLCYAPRLERTCKAPIFSWKAYSGHGGGGGLKGFTFPMKRGF